MVITSYDRTAKELLHRLKFGRARGAASDIGRIMATRASSPEMPFEPADSLMVPIPTAASRMRSRGYDQAALIARELAVRCDGSSATLLARTGSQRQLGASGEVRRRQMEGAFRVLRSYMLAEHDVVLVDDVLTTGSTLEAAARVLRAAGARRVSAIVFARA